MRENGQAHRKKGDTIPLQIPQLSSVHRFLEMSLQPKDGCDNRSVQNSVKSNNNQNSIINIDI